MDHGLRFQVLSEARPSGGRFAYYESETNLVDQLEQVPELGLSEISLYYPTDPTQLPMFEHLARDTIPKVRVLHRRPTD